MSILFCRECSEGKHVNCDGTALDPETDELTSCTCPDPSHGRSAEKDARHGVHCDGCLMLGFVTRLEKAEAQIDALTRALHLANVGVEPTAKWLDSKMAEIDARYAKPGGSDA